MLISAYDLGKVVAFEVGANGLPIPNTGKDLITGLNGAEGAVIDPVTGDFLFSTFGGGNRIILVSGFSTPTNVEKTPSTLEKLSLFPNPFKEVITLVAPSQVLGLKVQVQDANGLIVLETLQEKSNTIEMDLSKLPSGWFVIRVWSEDAVWVKKVLKQ
jgi:hypothetical protein